MTHSMHRQGVYDNLGDDFVVLGTAGRKFDNLPATFQQFDGICLRHQPVSVPATHPLAIHHFVYDSKEKVYHLLQDLATADLGLSITVSGLRDQVAECCHAAGLKPHTVCQSLGFWGRKELLPHCRVLEVSTMCGHGRVSPNLVWELARQVQHRTLAAGEASQRMNKLCRCRIFNSARAAKLVKKLAADLEVGAISPPQLPAPEDTAINKDFGITIDQAKCIGCLDCLPYCPVSAIIQSPLGDTVSIDAERCTECGVCWQAEICPVEAIVAKELRWPRTLRGKFHGPHSPYRAAPLLSPLTQTNNNNQLYARKYPPFSTELTSDVTGRYRHGEAEIEVELGRPYLGITFRDVQRVIPALMAVGLQLEQQYPPQDGRSPLTDLASDVSQGILRQDILKERTGWIPLKLEVPEEAVPRALQSFQPLAAEIDSIFAIDVISRVAEDGSTIADRVASKIGIKPAVNCKTNVGLGRPLATH